MDHLAGAHLFARLAEQANRLRHLQQLLDATLPAHLLPGTRIANLKRGKIVIHAASGAVAVKLRHLSPRLVEHFNQQGQEVTALEVRVQAHRPSTAGKRTKQPKVLGMRSKQALASLAAGLGEDSPVSQALKKLLGNA
ncbi:MAG: DciA family protein [Pseudomonadota bacterium]